MCESSSIPCSGNSTSAWTRSLSDRLSGTFAAGTFDATVTLSTGSAGGKRSGEPYEGVSGSRPTAGGSFLLLAVGSVSAFFGAVRADVLGVRIRPLIRTKSCVVRRARRQGVQNSFHVRPHMQVVPQRTAHQRQQTAHPLAGRNAAATNASRRCPSAVCGRHGQRGHHPRWRTWSSTWMLLTQTAPQTKPANSRN